MKITFLGDISLNNIYEKMYVKKEKPFTDVAGALKDSIVVGNLECLARGKQGVNELKKPRLETGLETLNYLKEFHLQVACLANNHVFDHLEDGFHKTVKFLAQNKIHMLGASLGNDNYKEPLIIEKRGIKIGLLNYVSEDTNPKPPKHIKIRVNWFDFETVVNDIKRLRQQVDHVVLILHWGGRVEGGLFPDWYQPKIARKLIDEGADLIIGHHSHTIQPYEVYKGKYIFYSLGNFCFSNIFHEGKLYSRLSKTQKIGMVSHITFYKNSYDVEINFIKIDKGFIKRIKEPYKILFVHKIYPIIRTILPIWQIYFFMHRKINPIFNYLFVQRKSLVKALSIKKIMKHLK